MMRIGKHIVLLLCALSLLSGVPLVSAPWDATVDPPPVWGQTGVRWRWYDPPPQVIVTKYENRLVGYKTVYLYCRIDQEEHFLFSSDVPYDDLWTLGVVGGYRVENRGGRIIIFVYAMVTSPTRRGNYPHTQVSDIESEIIEYDFPVVPPKPTDNAPPVSKYTHSHYLPRPFSREYPCLAARWVWFVYLYEKTVPQYELVPVEWGCSRCSDFRTTDNARAARHVKEQIEGRHGYYEPVYGWIDSPPYTVRSTWLDELNSIYSDAADASRKFDNIVSIYGRVKMETALGGYESWDIFGRQAIQIRENTSATVSTMRGVIARGENFRNQKEGKTFVDISALYPDFVSVKTVPYSPLLLALSESDPTATAARATVSAANNAERAAIRFMRENAVRIENGFVSQAGEKISEAKTKVALCDSEKVYLVDRDTVERLIRAIATSDAKTGVYIGLFDPVEIYRAVAKNFGNVPAEKYGAAISLLSDASGCYSRSTTNIGILAGIDSVVATRGWDVGYIVGTIKGIEKAASDSMRLAGDAGVLATDAVETTRTYAGRARNSWGTIKSVVEQKMVECPADLLPVIKQAAVMANIHAEKIGWSRISV